jgi:peptidoglycan/LPS O-acetylase OafA/YrhL
MAWNGPSWSLSVECCFYLLFPAIVRLGARISIGRFAILSLALLLAVTLARYAISSPSYQFESAALNFEMFFPVFHLPAFIVGVALGRAFVAGYSLDPQKSTLLFICSCGAVIVLLGSRLSFPDWTRSAPILIALYSLIIISGASLRSAVSAWMILLGESSYSLYILHVPLGWWYNWLTRSLISSPFLNFTIYFGIAVVASIFVFVRIERPLRRMILNHREHPDAPPYKFLFYRN